jgi:adenylate cyclase, class 1
VDPYLVLFKEVCDYYRSARDKESLQLVRMSFFLKTKVKDMCRKESGFTRWEERDVRRLFAGADGALAGPEATLSDEWSFERLVSVGGLVNKFIIRTYLKVRDQQAGQADIAISPQDLTKLGRKIFSSFSKRKFKIEHIPFVSMGGAPFRILHFSAYGKKMGSPEEWEIKGAQAVSSALRLQLVALRKGKDIVELLTWIAANSMYSPKMEIRGDYSISPVAAKDIENLLRDLQAFFPASATFNTDISETLNPERVVKAFLALNFAQPREKAQVLEVSIVYSTNWGELFCRTVQVNNSRAVENPLEFLAAALGEPLPEPPQLAFFIPERSACPKPAP